MNDLISHSVNLGRKKKKEPFSFLGIKPIWISILTYKDYSQPFNLLYDKGKFLHLYPHYFALYAPTANV